MRWLFTSSFRRTRFRIFVMRNLRCCLLLWSTFSFGNSFCLCPDTWHGYSSEKYREKTDLSVHRPPFFPWMTLADEAKLSVARLSTRPSSIVDDRPKTQVIYMIFTRILHNKISGQTRHVCKSKSNFHSLLAYDCDVQSGYLCVRSRYYCRILLRAVSRCCWKGPKNHQ